MPKRHTKVKKNKSRRRRQSGGAGGLGWTPGAPLTGLGDGLVENKAYDTCLSTARHGQTAFQYTGGLPGMRGGAYTNNLSTNFGGGFAQIDKVGCTPNHVNPLNRQSGGAGNMAASSSPVLTEVGARYTGTPSQWTGSTGSPFWVNQPLSGAAWSKACTQTAGRRRNKKKKTRSKKTRNTRRKQCGGGLLEDALDVLKANNMTKDQLLSNMIQSKDYTSGKTKEMGNFTFRATGVSRTFDLYVKRTGEADDSYVSVVGFRD